VSRRLGSTVTKREAEEIISTLLHAMQYLEKTSDDGVDLRPWVSRDHTIAVAHWILVQGRIEAVWAGRRLSNDPEAQRRGLRGIHTGKNEHDGGIAATVGKSHDHAVIQNRNSEQ
jgi:hypothetical protein